MTEKKDMKNNVFFLESFRRTIKFTDSDMTSCRKGGLYFFKPCKFERTC